MLGQLLSYLFLFFLYWFVFHKPFLFLCIVCNVVCKKMLYFYYVRNKDIKDKVKW